MTRATSARHWVDPGCIRGAFVELFVKKGNGDPTLCNVMTNVNNKCHSRHIALWQAIMHCTSLPFFACNIMFYNEHKLILKRYPKLFMCKRMSKVECDVDYKGIAWGVEHEGTVPKFHIVHHDVHFLHKYLWIFFQNKYAVNVPSWAHCIMHDML